MILALAAVTIGTLDLGRCAAQTAEAETSAAIARVKSLDSKIHAVIALDPTALDQARSIDQNHSHGSLYGCTILLKDNIEADGPLPTTAGTLALPQNVTHRDAPLVKRLRNAALSFWARRISPNGRTSVRMHPFQAGVL